jgi:VWFA-related protein
MGMKRVYCMMLLLSSFAGRAFAQVEPGRFAISQVTYQSPVLIAYADVLDQNGQPPAELHPSNFSARVAQRNLKISSVTSFDKAGEGVAYVFLVDVSKSIRRDQFDEMRREIVSWINGLDANDRMAIYTFGEQDKQLVDFTSDKTNLIASLQNLAPTDRQTKLYLALRNAIDVRQRTDDKLPSRRVVVILSDGKDEGSGFTADDVGRMVQASPIPIYAIGFSGLPESEKNLYLNALNRISSLSGGLYIEGSSLPEAYSAIRGAIRRVFIIKLDCEGCQVSTQAQPLELTLKTGTATRTDRLAVSLSLPPEEPEEEPFWKRLLAKISWKTLISLGFGLAFVITIPVVITINNRKKESKPGVLLVPVPGPMVAPPPISILPARKILLTVVSGNEHSREDKLDLTAKAVIGRDKACDVSYPKDSEMSAKHFELILVGKHVELLDLGSTNGTLLNGARLVVQQRIEDGDWVRAGRTEIRINFGA